MTILSSTTQVLIREPRRLIFIAAVMVLAGIVAGYLSVYDQADRTLALRQGPPAPVAIQNYDPSRNMGPAREVVLRAEADLTRPLVLTLRGTTPPRTVLALPLFRLSDKGEAAVMSQSDGATAGIGAQVARRAEAPATRPVALGMLMIELDGRPPESVDLKDHVTTFGPGRAGTAIEINGQSSDPGGFALMVDGALSVQNIGLSERAVTVTPFLEGRLAALAAEAPVIDRGRYFFWMASALSLLALALSLAGFGSKDRRRQVYERERAGSESWSGGGKTSSHFEPLPSQEEVMAADAAERPEPGAWRLLKLAGVYLLRSIRALFRIRRRR